MEFTMFAMAIGVGATALTDLAMLLRRRVFGVPTPNYRLVGRWIGHMRSGRLRHDSIAAAAPVSVEALIGWLTHYAIGIAFAGMLLGICGLGWAQRPTPLPAILTGLATVAAPFLIMQPAMGAGIAASRTPRPGTARLHSLVLHATFGVSLYVVGEFLSWIL